ncbi:hypothetical protein F53441_13448 [Fusarium austroafricanum]|uniref:Uncharacterized protein n=1 Tax=Fusarium austroafricanum TaxID=2364996 RepID=A0A8H4JRK3_9HYPO|nr:hypothetical protein F53441_13448 [Fusarium austroafricanum]
MDSLYASSIDLSSDSEPKNVPQGATYRNRHQTKERFEGPGTGKSGSSEPTPEGLEDLPLYDESESEPEIDDGEPWHLVAPVDVDGADSHARLAKQQPGPYAIPFNDSGMEDIEPEDGEENTEDRSKEEDRAMLSDYAIPMGPHLSDPCIGEPQPSLMGNASGLAQNLPGTQALRRTLSTTANIAQNNLASSYASLTGGLLYAAQRTCDAVAATGQVGGNVVEGALDMSRGAVVRVQESWGNLPQTLNRGVNTLTEFVMEGVQSLPPSDSIIRPKGRRLH